MWEFFRLNNVLTCCRDAEPPCVYIRMHKNDHVRTLKIRVSEFDGLRKQEKTQHALNNWLVLVSALLLQLAFLPEGNPNFPWENSHSDNKVYEIQIHFPVRDSTIGIVVCTLEDNGLMDMINWACVGLLFFSPRCLELNTLPWMMVPRVWLPLQDDAIT